MSMNDSDETKEEEKEIITESKVTLNSISTQFKVISLYIMIETQHQRTHSHRTQRKLLSLNAVNTKKETI